MLSYFISIFIGIGAGFLYEFGFFYNHTLTKTAPLSFFSKIIFTFLRFTFITIFFWYVLHASSVNTILIISSFFISFWTKILAKRF